MQRCSPERAAKPNAACRWVLSSGRPCLAAAPLTRAIAPPTPVRTRASHVALTCGRVEPSGGRGSWRALAPWPPRARSPLADGLSPGHSGRCVPSSQQLEQPNATASSTWTARRSLHPAGHRYPSGSDPEAGRGGWRRAASPDQPSTEAGPRRRGRLRRRVRPRQAARPDRLAAGQCIRVAYRAATSPASTSSS
jgi:hypothetical protein